jgi:hypothetical protein
MKSRQIDNPGQVYAIVDQLQGVCKSHGLPHIATELDFAMRQGGTGREVMGAITHVIENNYTILCTITEPGTLDDVSTYVKQLYGS